MKENKEKYSYRGFIGTVNEIILHFGLDIRSATVNKRLRNGYTIKEAIEIPENNVAYRIYTYNDFTGTVTEIVKHFNLSIRPETVRSRLQAGYTIKEAIDEPVKSHYQRKYTFKGFRGSVNEILKHFDIKIPKSIIRKRIQAGWDAEDIFTP